MATANIIAHEKISLVLQRAISKIFHEEKDRLRASLSPTSGQTPDNVEPRLRSLYCPSAAGRVKVLYDEAVKSGAKIFAGTPDFDVSTGLVQPVFLQCKENMRIFTEEAFAPIVTLIPFKTDEQAIHLANAPGAGLTASIFTANESKGWFMANEIISGAVHINGLT